MDAKSFIAEHVEKIRPVSIRAARVWWELNTTGEERFAKRSAKLREKLGLIYANEDEYRALVAWDESDDSGILADRILGRQIHVLRLDYAGAQKDAETIKRESVLTSELTQTFTNFRPVIDGETMSQNELSVILREETDEARRRAAWEALHEVGPAAEAGILELVELRNSTAQKLGYRDYYAMSLELGEIDEEALLALLDGIEEQTAAPFAEVKAELDDELAERFRILPDALMPWHYADPFFQSAPPGGGVDLDPFFREKDLESLTVATYQGMGLDIRKILERSDLYPREGKCEHAFCTNIDRVGDVRVLCNIVPSERWTSTMLHEFGHAVYDAYISPDLPFLLRRPAHALMTEAVAMMMQRFSQDAGWLAAVAGVPEEEAVELANLLAERTRLVKLIFMRWALIMCRFERELYGDPDLDRNRRWWELRSSLQSIHAPDERDAPDWAAKIHLAVAPVYYQNYLLGELVASQLEAYLRANTPTGEIIGSRTAGRTLVDRLFRQGRLRNWRETLEQMTGEPLDPKYFLEQYGID